ncbi:Transcriptional regulatory protein ZraR [Pirellula sp. SH-Sr6A]|uniref:sigma-54-dependent transcriptional regulator n=1 Tax=Pirellula sp. SH-Sr6A TaxID=1632865 RepID=UPI00078CF45A|nr:sigma-54 dependent transcriptional regulator [Pirellula sp. SH-Sr6A]AMV32346.1 Transcriptional regulatory protein ZraR [Pirellula sp. SH-Sr6A]
MNPLPSILLADDEPLFGETTSRYLRNHGYQVNYVMDGHAALKALETQEFQAIIADLDMPGNRDLELLQACRKRFAHTPFVVVTGRPTLPSAIEGIRLGIHDYFLKPFELADLLHSIHRALPNGVAKQEFRSGAYREILGESAAMQDLKAWLDRVSHSNATVLVRGESGTGKELIAREIHQASLRSNQPYITIDCASIPESLIESTLFGHVKGSFTGATADKMGLIAQADRGTVFLDEIGELPLPMQAKLLRVLQFGTFIPVGGTEEVRVDARVIAATNRDLSAEVSRGKFRLDLYYRLSVLEVVPPPLRDRIDDMEMLAQHFLDRIAQRDRKPKWTLHPTAIEALRNYSWPGNVRELQNTIERCGCLAKGQTIYSTDIAASLSKQVTSSAPVMQGSMDTAPKRQRELPSWHGQHAQSEKLYLEGLLAQYQGNVSQAAKAAGITRQGLHKAIVRLGLDIHSFRTKGRSTEAQTS